MKFPSHVLVDVNRPLINPKASHLKWQDFYKTIFLNSNSFYTSSSSPLARDGKRVTVMRDAVHFLDKTSYLNLKNLDPHTQPGGNAPKKIFFSLKENLTQDQLKFIQLWLKNKNARNSSINQANSKIWTKASGKIRTLRTLEERRLDQELELYSRLSLYFLTTRSKKVKVENPTTVDVKAVVARAKAKTQGKLDYRFCFKNFTVNLKTNPTSKTQQQEGFYTKKTQTPHTSQLHTNFDIHFLLKEMHYSKLKYSKTAERDIVSSGSAAIFAGFIGFLISEKFGIELVDSGDFYFAFMYAVFFGFALKIWFAGVESGVEEWRPLTDPRSYTYKSHRWYTGFVHFFNYVYVMTVLFLRFLKRLPFGNKIFSFFSLFGSLCMRVFRRITSNIIYW